MRPDGDPNGTENINNLRVCDLRDISPDGDVILLVGPESIRLRVSSHSLRAASPVFNVMFGPHWKEGQSLCASQPTEVRLEDDDADVMQLICCVIHHKNEDIPDAIEPRTALKLAIVVDKYDCATAMKYYLKQVLRPSGLAMETLSEQAYMVAAAFILQDDTLFRDLTRALLVEFKPCYTTLLEDAELRKHLPTEFFCKQFISLLFCFWSQDLMSVAHSVLLSEKGSRTRVQLAQWPQQRLGKSCDCEANRARVEYYKSISKRLNSYRVTLLKIPIRHIINDLSRFSIKGIEDVSSCSLRCCKSIPDTGSKREIEVALSRTYVSISEVKNISGTKG